MNFDRSMCWMMALGLSLLFGGACSDSGTEGETTSSSTTGDGDGDQTGDGDGDQTGDGDGDQTGDGDGDGDQTGDGDGDQTGDGDGDQTGDGDGDQTGDGDGDGVCGPDDATPPVGQLCVRGEFVEGQELLEADGPVRFQLFPEGCYSSDCTVVITSTCEVVDARTSDIVLAGSFCLGTEGDCTLPDCSGGGWSECDLPSVAAGDYTVTLGDLQLEFSVPSVLDGSNCVGDPFG